MEYLKKIFSKIKHWIIIAIAKCKKGNQKFKNFIQRYKCKSDLVQSSVLLGFFLGITIISFAIIVIFSDTINEKRFPTRLLIILLFLRAGAGIGTIISLVITIIHLWKKSIIWRDRVSPIAKRKRALREEEIKKEQELAEAIESSINDGVYPEMKVDIILPEGEHCLTAYAIYTYKNKTVTNRVGYSGVSYSIRIAKGFRYRVGTISPAVEKKVVKYIDDTGILYVTNHRLIMKMDKKVDNIKYEKLLYLEMIPGGVVLYKDTGTPKQYYFAGDYKTFPIYVSALMNIKNKEIKAKKEKSKRKGEVIEMNEKKSETIKLDGATLTFEEN